MSPDSERTQVGGGVASRLRVVNLFGEFLGASAANWALPDCDVGSVPRFGGLGSLMRLFG